MPFHALTARAVVAVRAYRALCRKHLAPPRDLRANPCCPNLTQEHRDDLHHPAACAP